MKNIIFNQEGKLTKFAFWTTVLVIVTAIYFLLGGALGALQEGIPIRAK